MQVTKNRTVDANGRKLNLTGTCRDCGGTCTFNAKRCERCAKPKRKPQRKDLQIKK